MALQQQPTISSASNATKYGHNVSASPEYITSSGAAQQTLAEPDRSGERAGRYSRDNSPVKSSTQHSSAPANMNLSTSAAYDTSPTLTYVTDPMLPSVTRGQVSHSPATCGQTDQSPVTHGHRNHSPISRDQRNQPPVTHSQIGFPHATLDQPAAHGQTGYSPAAHGQTSVTHDQPIHPPAASGQMNQSPAIYGQMNKSEVSHDQTNPPPTTAGQTRHSTVMYDQTSQPPVSYGQVNQPAATQGQMSHLPAGYGHDSQVSTDKVPRSQSPHKHSVASPVDQGYMKQSPAEYSYDSQAPVQYGTSSGPVTSNAQVANTVKYSPDVGQDLKSEYRQSGYPLSQTDVKTPGQYGDHVDHTTPADPSQYQQLSGRMSHKPSGYTERQSYAISQPPATDVTHIGSVSQPPVHTSTPMFDAHQRGRAPTGDAAADHSRPAHRVNVSPPQPTSSLYEPEAIPSYLSQTSPRERYLQGRQEVTIACEKISMK